MNERPMRKNIRLKNYDYSSAGAYFVTICTKNRKMIFWNNLCDKKLTKIGEIAQRGIEQISQHYLNVTVDNYCIMSDHVHLIITIQEDFDERHIATPTLSNIVGQMKRWVSSQIGESVWQKSYIDKIIRTEQGYKKVWEYIENNPIKIDFAYDNIDFSETS